MSLRLKLLGLLTPKPSRWFRWYPDQVIITPLGGTLEGLRKFQPGEILCAEWVGLNEEYQEG